MGNLCCISSKKQKKCAHKPTQASAKYLNSSYPTNTNKHLSKKKTIRSPDSPEKLKKLNRQSEIDYYYDDYEELAQQNSSRHYQKKYKLAAGERKYSNKSSLSYYSSDVRVQDINCSHDATQTTLLNTIGLDVQPSHPGSLQIIDDSPQYRDNSKIMNHLILNKKIINRSQFSQVVNLTSNHGKEQPNLVTKIDSKNQIVNHKYENIFDGINLSKKKDFKELKSSSNLNKFLKHQKTIKYLQFYSLSSIDFEKTTPLKHNKKFKEFRSEPNLLNKLGEKNFDNPSNLSVNLRLNNCFTETNLDMNKDHFENSDSKNEQKFYDDKDSKTENNLNLEKYRSLQKTKRSIQRIEETIKSSRSIEQWLNDFDKLESNGDIDYNCEIKLKEKPSITKRKLVKLDNFSSPNLFENILTDKLKRSRTSLDENDENDYILRFDSHSDKTSIIERKKELINEPPFNKKNSIDSTYSSINLDLTSHESNSANNTLSVTDTSEFLEDESSFNNFLAELSSLFDTNKITNKKLTAYPLTCQKLFDTIEYLMHANRSREVRKLEKNMTEVLSEFLLPRSNTNSDDIDLLRWLLTDRSTLNLKLVEPIINKTLCADDNFLCSTQKNLRYLLIANSLRVKLVDSGDSQIKLTEGKKINSDDLEIEKIASLASCNLYSNAFLKFQLDRSYNELDNCQTAISSTGHLILEKNFIDLLVNSEKKLVQNLSGKLGRKQTTDKYESDFDLASDKKIIDQLHRIFETSNFKGAQCLYNIKKKQLINKKNIPINNSSILNCKNKVTGDLLIPLLINSTMPLNRKHNHSSNSSGTTSPSSSSISPASINRTSNNNNTHKDTGISPYSTFVQSNVFQSCSNNYNQLLVQAETTSSANYIKFCDLNERLFNCLLSNFSSNLVDSFLKKTDQALTSTGFIRKKKIDKSFQYVSIQKRESLKGDSTLNLFVEKSSFKLCLKIDKWPQSYESGFFYRKRINLRWPTKETLTDIYENQGLITYAEPNEILDSIYECYHNQDDQTLFNEQNPEISNNVYYDSFKWKLNTTLAESTLFRSLSKQNTFQFYFLYIVFMNINVQLSDETESQLRKTKNLMNCFWKIELPNLKFFNFVNERIFMHHYFRFLEIEESPDTDNQNEKKLDILNLINILKKFSGYLNFILEKYNSLNQPNYFDMNKKILCLNELKSLFGTNLRLVPSTMYDLFNRDIHAALKDFDKVLNQNLLSKLNINSNGLTKLMEIQNFKYQCQQYPGNLLWLLNNYLDKIQLNLPNKITFDKLYFSPLPAHFNTSIYMYRYVFEYTSIIFDQFKAKRDQFKISENLLITLHTKIINEKFNPSSSRHNQFLNSIEKIDLEKLFSKFEEYAECVHKYLPQIRHKNQYLLFHYVWTMQVQYMAPFFNYLCDSYPLPK